ncbi:hypothetical protein [Staphylococcus haemolyticus]|jgi:hypothetical protein|uniref:hypothetical protein n=1 Tax=Staphylococcus haemolyticus TaxID=1283 RepID=UPI001642FB6F|nr:hypothetical protein [Staphylococcus haemolyticus]MBC3103878.1 hypothetical protein [Staphylococcus haemolyticus]MBC3144717.1 hypothetical protein [Staphylococcus haemolyticus]
MFDWVKDKAGDALNWGLGKISELLDFTGVLKLMMLEVIQDCLNGTFKILKTTVLSYDNYKVLPNSDILLELFSQLAIYLLAFFLIYKALNMMINGGLGADVDFIRLIFDTVKSMIFIKLSPWLIQFFLLAINKGIVEFILNDKQLGMGDITKLNFEKNIAKIIGVKSLKKIGAIADTEKIQWFGIGIILILAIAILVFNIYGALRVVNIVICLLVSPVMAATRILGDSYWRVFVTETIAVIFSQIFHVICLFWLLKLMVDKWTMGNIFLMLSVIMVGISGAHIIRRFTYATGASQVIGGTSKMAVYKFMTRR